MSHYVKNANLLAEIHNSKVTYCTFDAPEHSRYDAIVVGSIDAITDEIIATALTKRTNFLNKNSKSDEPINPVKLEDLVFRVMTSEHIPIDPNPDKKRRNRSGDNDRMRTNFPPFKHYVFREGTYHEVGRSHWKNGEFSPDGGNTTNSLAMMYMLLVEQYSKSFNWRNYTWLNDMKGQALLQLTQVGLQFDESKSQNPFAFFTTVLTNCFKRVVNLERKYQNIRDDLVIMAGATPSFRRQVENEMEYRNQDKAYASTTRTEGAGRPGRGNPRYQTKKTIAPSTTTTRMTEEDDYTDDMD